ncbi:MAG: hypothetical protein KAJ10_13440, partial [Thermodesulfovibrionia bacterium]|nr:hypothetical protein [Thermodesulfovibrionia bacterium]
AEEATAVVVGAWNVAILNPRWIATEILKLPMSTAIPMELGVGPGISVRAKIADLFFVPASDRLIINPSREEEALFKLTDQAIENLFEVLPHTPIEAIGYNFLYSLDDDEDFAIDVKFEASNYDALFKKFNASAGQESVVQHSLVILDDSYVVLNLQMKILGKKKLLVFNYHYQAKNDKARIKQAINKFYKNHRHSQDSLSSLIIRR